MPRIEVRPTTTEDIDAFINLRHDYMTSHVWQMDRILDDGQVNIKFREMRLPRAVEVYYPNYYQLKNNDWLEKGDTLTALHSGKVVGYIKITEQPKSSTAWITDVVVDDKMRRMGIGSALVIAAQEWAVERNLRWLIIEMQLKNYPGIKMASKLGFEFSGYSDHYYPNQDIALFFAKYLR